MKARVITPGLVLALLALNCVLATAAQQRTRPPDQLAPLHEAMRAGKYDEAEKLLLADIAEAKQHGADNVRLADLMSNFESIYRAKGDTSRAIDIAKQVLTMHAAALGEDHPKIINDLNNLAMIYESNQQPGEAEKCWKRAWDIQRRLPEARGFPQTMIPNNLAMFYLHQKRYAESEAVLKEAIEMQDRTPAGRIPPAPGNLKEALAQVYRQEGRTGDAEALFAEAAKSQRPGPQDPVEDAMKLTAQARRLVDDNDFASAEQRYQQAIAELESAPRERGSRLLPVALDQLADLCQRKGRNADAERLYRRALQIREDNATSKDPQIARNLSFAFQIQNLYREQGRIDEMEPIFEQVLGIQEKVLGPNDGALADTLLAWARVEEEEKNYEQALPLCERALKIQENNWGPDAPRLVNTLEACGRLLENMGKAGEAAAMRSRAETILKKGATPGRVQRE